MGDLKRFCHALVINVCSALMLDFSSVVMPRPGVRPWWGGENLFSSEEPVSKKTTGSADQQQSQAAGPLLLYPLAPGAHPAFFCSLVVLCLKYCEMPWPPTDLRRYRNLLVCVVASPRVLPVALYPLWSQRPPAVWKSFIQISPCRW